MPGFYITGIRQLPTPAAGPRPLPPVGAALAPGPVLQVTLNGLSKAGLKRLFRHPPEICLYLARIYGMAERDEPGRQI
ncbi:MAG: hypothetical protein GX216_04010 [Methanomicrobiales archaeon]|nr:hypothetical protein [Methanomicrobiales archaeon]